MCGTITKKVAWKAVMHIMYKKDSKENKEHLLYYSAEKLFSSISYSKPQREGKPRQR